MTYTQWLIKLISIIMEDAKLSINEIALTDEECKHYFEQKINPETVYFDVWQQDAGNYYAI